jgi:hypothetical protein
MVLIFADARRIHDIFTIRHPSCHRPRTDLHPLGAPLVNRAYTERNCPTQSPEQ